LWGRGGAITGTHNKKVEGEKAGGRKTKIASRGDIFEGKNSLGCVGKNQTLGKRVTGKGQLAVTRERGRGNGA